MSRRFKLDRRSSKRMFTRHARGHHPMNDYGMPMRGGIRL